MQTAPTFAGALRDLLLTQMEKPAQVSYIKKKFVCLCFGGLFLDLTFYLFTYIYFNPSVINIQCHISFRCTIWSFSNTTGIFWCPRYGHCGTGTSPKHVVRQDYVLGSLRPASIPPLLGLSSLVLGL